MLSVIETNQKPPGMSLGAISAYPGQNTVLPAHFSPAYEAAVTGRTNIGSHVFFMTDGDSLVCLFALRLYQCWQEEKQKRQRQNEKCQESFGLHGIVPPSRVRNN